MNGFKHGEWLRRNTEETRSAPEEEESKPGARRKLEHEPTNANQTEAIPVASPPELSWGTPYPHAEANAERQNSSDEKGFHTGFTEEGLAAGSMQGKSIAEDVAHESPTESELVPAELVSEDLSGHNVAPQDIQGQIQSKAGNKIETEGGTVKTEETQVNNRNATGRESTTGIENTKVAGHDPVTTAHGLSPHTGEANTDPGYTGNLATGELHPESDNLQRADNPQYAAVPDPLALQKLDAYLKRLLEPGEEEPVTPISQERLQHYLTDFRKRIAASEEKSSPPDSVAPEGPNERGN